MKRELQLITIVLLFALSEHANGQILTPPSRPERAGTYTQREYLLTGNIEKLNTSRSPVAGAIITIENTGLFTTSNSQGQFSMHVNQTDLTKHIMVTIKGFGRVRSEFHEATWTETMDGCRVIFYIKTIEVSRPDADGDGITDDEDKCPTLRGTARYQGCPVPDTDNDGINDEKDKCPDVAGVPRYYGCPVPDMDKDGINDEEDKCPTLPGTARYQGCPVPDTDSDGINDEKDKCPEVAGVARYNGCPIPDTDNDGVNDEEDKCINEKGTAENFGCPATTTQSKWNFTVKNKIRVRGNSNEANRSIKELLKNDLINERIMPTDASAGIIARLNPGLKEKLMTQDQTELVLPEIPKTGEKRETELAEEFDRDNMEDSSGSANFTDKCRQFSKLYNLSLPKIKDTILLEKMYSIYNKMEKVQNNSGMLLKKYEADILNQELADFYDYYLELSLKDNYSETDTAYVNEFNNKLTSILRPYFKNKKSSAGDHGPNTAFAGYFDETDPRVMTFFYVYTADNRAPRDSFWIYTLNERQYKRLSAKEINFDVLDKPASKCQYRACVTSKPLDYSHTWYIVAVRKDAPHTIIAASIIDKDTIQEKPNKPEITERFAVLLDEGQIVVVK